MKLKHLLIMSRYRSLNSALKSSTRYLSSHSSTIHPNAPTHFTRPTNYTTPISTFTRSLHSAEPTIPVETETDPEEEEEEDVTMTEFLSRFVWIMRGKLADAYPGVNKETVNGMLLIIVARVVDELERGGVGEMIFEGSAKTSYDFSEELWKTVWEVSNNVLEDMNKARKKEEMKKYIQSEDVKEMCRFASEVGVRGNMLREFRFKWAKEKMEEAELYQSLHQMREQAEYDAAADDEEQELGTEDEERKEGEEGEADQVTINPKLNEEVVKNGSDVHTEMKPKVVSLPQRRGKIKYNIYGLDLSDPKWAQVADKIHESEKLITPEEPKPITGKCKLVTEKILQLTEGDDPSPLFAEWKELLEPSRVDWVTLLDRLRENNAGIYLKAAELILDEDSFQANIRDYAKLIDAHAKADRMDAAERILQKMAEKNIQPDILISAILVQMYSKAGFLDRAKEAFGQLRSQGFQLDMRVYSSMIMACINAGDLKTAETLMHDMDARDNKPSKEIYMALLGAYSERGLIDGSFRISTLMQYAGFEPTLESCTLLVEAYARAGDDAMAKREFDHMRNLGLKPGDRCAASLISLYEKKNHLDKALDLLLELESDGFEPGIATYIALVDWFGKLQLIQEAEEAFRRITEKGGTPPLKVHVSLCDMYSRAHDEKKALQALGIVEGKKDLLGKEEFERIISGLLAGGLQEDARRIHGMMETRGFSASEQIKLSLMASNAFRVQRPGARVT